MGAYRLSVWWIETPTGIVPYLGEIDAESIHIQAIKKTGEIFAETRQTLVHQLQVHEVGFQIGHGIGQFCKLWLQRVDGGLRITSPIVTASISMSVPERRS